MILSPAENPLCLGHDGALKVFLKAFHSGRLPHSWIITGPEGVGKRTFCYQLIRFLFSGQASFETFSLEPQDPLFRRIASKTHADLLVLEKREDASGLSVDDIRQVNGFCQKTTAEGGWRLVLLEGLDQVNRFGANALLKSLEEPPPQTLFFLTAQTLAGILPTIRSRCQVLPLKPLGEDALKSALGKMGYPPLSQEEAQHILPLAQGCLGKAIYFRQEERWRKMVAFYACLLRANLPPRHARYQAPFTRENIALFSSEPLSFWQEFWVGWFEGLLRKEMVGPDALMGEEKEVFEQASPALWWHRRDQVKAQFTRSIQLHLDPLHTFACAFALLRGTDV